MNSVRFLVSHRLELALAARRAGYEVVVAAPFDDWQAVSTLREAGVRCFNVSIARGAGGLVRDIVAAWHLQRLIRSLPDPLVHCITLKGIVVGGVSCQMSTGARCVFAVAGLGAAYTGRGFLRAIAKHGFEFVIKLLGSSAGSIFIVQNRDDEAVLRRVAGARGARIVLIPGSGVDLARFSLSREIDQVNPVVLFPARVLADKGVREFVQAARILAARGVGARFCIAGMLDPGNPSAISAAEIEEWTREGSVEWLGHVDDMPTLLSRTLVCCLPSYREGMPKVLLEAAAAGASVVTTDVPGCRDAVLPGVSGLLVPARDPSALAEAVSSLIANRELAESMGIAGRRMAAERFSVWRVVEETLSVYESAYSKQSAEYS